MMRGALAVGLAVATLGLNASTAKAYPSVVWTCNGSPCTGWFRSDVHLVWDVKVGTPTTPTSCVNPVIVNDTPETTRTCTLSDTDGDATFTARIKLDKTAPTVTNLAPDRLPDYLGWYNHPVTFAVQGSDVTSGLDGCGAASYAGPDSASAGVVATCRDRAGNIGSLGYPLSYDATPPDPSPAAVKTGDRVVRLTWAAGATASVMRTPGTDGATSSVLYQGGGTGFTDREVRNRRDYRYVLTLTDQAGNVASRELAATPQRKLLTPARGAIVAAPPLLKWTPVRGARYYNVQLLRKGRKILSAWPKLASLQLKQTWRYHGRRYRLKPGKYSWYVWPGKGPRSARRYGERMGPRTFVVQPGA